MKWLTTLLLLVLLILNYQVYSWSFSSYMNQAVDYTLCAFTECCRKENIPADFDGLEQALKERVYGQHLVHTITDALRSHWEYGGPKKPLTISFHGWPGGGKNYVANFIAQYLFKKGSQSDFVHWYIGRLHFPEESHLIEYKKNLYSWIKGNTTKCPQQLFVFDEVDKMPPGLLNAVKTVIDYRESVEGVDYRKAIFIFLSNTGQNLINSKYLEYWNAGTPRESLKLSDFESLILRGAFNEDGGFHQSDTIQSNLIDHYIPFLPLEMKHVKACIVDEFRRRGVNEPKKEHIEDVLEIIDWGPAREKAFSKTGCKRVSQKVSLLVAKHYRHLIKKEL